MSFRRISAGAFVVLFAAATSAQQAPVTPTPAPTGLIVGQTVDGVSGKPVGGTVVTLSLLPMPIGAGVPAAQTPPAMGPMRQVTDRDGHFVFHGLEAGTYSLTATKPGYLDAAFGRRTAGGASQSVVLQSGQPRGGCDLRLWRYAAISGTITDEDGEPVANIQVKIVKRGVLAGVRRLMFVVNNPSTDDRGRYRASGLVPGEYVVGVVKTQATVPTSVVEAASAAMRGGGSLDFDREISRSSPMASLGGNLAMTSGQRVGDLMLTAPSTIGGPAQSPLLSGTGPAFVYPSTFYPSATSAAMAQVVAVDVGEDRSGVDLRLTPVPAVRVSGTLTGPSGPEAMTTISLVSTSGDEWQRDYDIATATAMTDGSGAFTFLGVPAGAYTIRVLKVPPRPVSPPSQNMTVIQTANGGVISSGGGPAEPPPIPQAPTLWVQQSLSVADHDITDLSLALRSGARVTGRLEFVGTADPPAADRLRQGSIQIDPADGRETSLNQGVTLARGAVDASGQFKTYEEPPGRYLIRGGSFPGWTFAGAFVADKPVGDAGLEIGGEDVTGVVLRFTDQPSDLSGTVRDRNGPDGAAAILVFPASSSAWINTGRSPLRLRLIRAGTSGAYRATGLPAGDYLLIAVKNERADWQEAKYLASIASLATRITLGNGDHKVQDLQTQEIK
jgi:hypothetical protein